MKKVLGITLLGLLIIALLPSVSVAGEKQFGEKMTLETPITVDDLLKDADAKTGKLVQVEGRIADVCAMAGCWIVVASETSDEDIKFKVDDGVIVFPEEVKGKFAVVEGTLNRIEMNLEDSRGYLAHLAEERGEEFDTASVTEPMSFFQIQGAGAVVSYRD